MRPPTYTKLLREAVKAARNENPTITGYEQLVGTPYKVRVESIRIRPTGGPCRAFAYWYSIVDSTNLVVFGAIDRADSFVSLANTWLAFRMMEQSSLENYAMEGWKVAQDEIAWRKNNQEAQ